MGGWGRWEEKEREDITANQQVPKSPTKLENVGRCRGKRCWEEGRATGSELLERWGHPGDFMAVTTNRVGNKTPGEPFTPQHVRPHLHQAHSIQSCSLSPEPSVLQASLGPLSLPQSRVSAAKQSSNGTTPRPQSGLVSQVLPPHTQQWSGEGLGKKSRGAWQA